MSTVLRQKVRELLQRVEDDVQIEDGTLLAEIRSLVKAEERAEASLEPAAVHAHELEVARLVDALGRFRKMSGHFVGCTADKDGRICSAGCSQAQAALDPRIVARAHATVDRLLETIRAQEHDRRELQRQLVRTEAAAGLVKRPRGRPRKMAKASLTSGAPDAALS